MPTIRIYRFEHDDIFFTKYISDIAKTCNKSSDSYPGYHFT